MIHLIRHGETPGNARRFLQFPGTPLSERGLEQARRLGERLACEEVNRILSSDYARAAATAGQIAAATGAPIEYEPLLRERHFGALRGTPYHELQVNPFAPDYTPPDGESWAIFHARVDRAWERILEAAAGGPLVVVTHGLVGLSLARRRLTLPANQASELTGLANTSLTSVETTPPFRVTRLNCTAHLEDTAAPPGAPA
ncbi:MAG: histidine phosphatase family protein [Myxococcota bacterium]|nr:phosphoglycerate mutase [Deltaproteobacteria bacterium]MCP4239814.1 histidine phosphatase family protein [bacterium]MDP6074533.1 histidine phosphatase family protein [Myxococcota bacterium]MDP6244466.1 histidine phosphatase family protein [Myxococcota bacterium]MDP7073918.1 histidine phosphatase family protein [Myxococcota bacterium]